jgi:hypothetical protein
LLGHVYLDRGSSQIIHQPRVLLLMYVMVLILLRLLVGHLEDVLLLLRLQS